MSQENVSVGAAAPSRGTLFVLALMRMAIGWHFLYEGWVKLFDAKWSAGEYLRNSTGPLAAQFQRIAADATLLKVVDQANIWALLIIGLCLMLGLFTRLAAFGGMALLALYYIAYPPFFADVPMGATEGHYLLVSKNLVELMALFVVFAVPAANLGLDGVRAIRRARRAEREEAVSPGGVGSYEVVPVDVSRRRMITGLIGVPVVGAFVLSVLKKHGWASHEERNLLSRADARSGATLKFTFSRDTKDLKGQLPQGQIGNLKLSRMILGGNLIGGWAHARDLIYVSKLVKAYHHRDKVFETFRLAEACGVNTILTNPLLCGIINDYWKTTGGKIQFISDCGGNNVLEMIQKSIDNGAAACYIQGALADELVAKGDFDTIAKGVELIRKNNIPAGIGGHHLQTIMACVDKGFKPDFWMKTLHHVNYWSAQPKSECDNIWCNNPEQTIEYMKSLPQPWIAFKTLAAGAIKPEEGFRYAFSNGADFICVGMYDFQMIEDVNICLDVLNSKLERQRAWVV